MTYDVNIKEMSNKSRKGSYVYIKEEGKKPRYYKYYPGSSLDAYYELYKLQQKNKASTKRFIEEKSKDYFERVKKMNDAKSDNIFKEIRKYPRINEFLKNKMTFVDTDLFELRKDSYKETAKLLEPVVLDKKMLDIIAKQPTKLRTRLMTKVLIYGTDNRGYEGLVGELVIKGATPNEIRDMLNDNLEEELDYSSIDRLAKAMKASDKRKNKIPDGLKLSAVKIRIIFA